MNLAPEKPPSNQGPSVDDLWPDRVDGDLYTRIVRIVRDFPGGVRFPYLVHNVSGGEKVYRIKNGKQFPSAVYQRVRKSVDDLDARAIVRLEQRPDIVIVDGKAVEIDRPNADLWVYPEWIPPVLNNSRQNPPGTSHNNSNRLSVPGSIPGRAPGGRAAETARSVLRDRCQITPGQLGDGVRAALRHALAAHREGVDTEGMGSDRVSDPSRVARQQAAFLSSLETASAQFNHGTLLTLTARPGESGDLLDGAIAVIDSVGPLRKHLGRQTSGSGRPDAVVVPHISDRGVLHLHVVIFGVIPADLDRRALSQYWHETREHGYIVDISPVTVLAGRWVFANHATADTDNGRYVRSYLGSMLVTARHVAETSPEALHAGEVPDAWKVAILWAGGLPVLNISTSLRELPS